MSEKPSELFKIKYKGYDARAVDEYFYRNGNQLDEMQKRAETAEKELAELKQSYEKLVEEHTTLKNNIESRERAADEISRIALKEANTIVETANRNADSIVKEALATARQILVEMSNLGNEAIFLKKHVKERMDRLAKVIDDFTLPNIPSLDCLELIDENDEKDA